MTATATPPAPAGSDAADQRTRRRFARRLWLRRWRVWRWLIAVVVVIGLIGGGIWLLWFSQQLTVRAVEIRGAETLTDKQVRRIGKVPVGEQMIRTKLAPIDARLEAVAAVRDVEVAKIWPDTIRITITERTPVAVVSVGGQWRGMDEEGVLFRDYPRAPRQLPQIRTSTEVDSEVLREAALVLAALPSEVTAKVAYCSVESIDEIRLELRDGREVLWGSAEQSVDKGRVLGPLLKRRADFYDVSVPGLPTYR